jgi:exocyst complex protein 7
MNSMALLLKAILTAAGPACRLKSTAANISTNVSSVTNKKTTTPSRHEHETAQDTRRRLTDALQKKDLLKSVGEYEDIFPLDSTSLREIRAIMECLRGDSNNNGSYLGASSVLQQRQTQQQQAPLSDIPPGTKVARTEKVGSGFYSNLSKRPINTGYPLLDAYGEARKTVALASLENFHRHLKAEQKKKVARQPRSSSTAAGQVTKSITAAAGGTTLIANTASVTNSAAVDVDTAARDAVRCLEHAMVVVAGEKTIYRSIISKTVDSSKEPLLSPEYVTACVHAYSYVASAVVDRAMDIIELVFFKEAGIGLQQQQQPSITTVPTSTSEASETGAGSPSPLLSIRAASSAAAAGLRILDGVRILGPSLAKLCELSEYRGDSQQLLAGQLCISIHRTTVKQCARTLENLVKAIQTESSDGDQYTLSSNVVRAIRIISPFAHAYKSVSKRRLVAIDEKINQRFHCMKASKVFLIQFFLG